MNDNNMKRRLSLFAAPLSLLSLAVGACFAPAESEGAVGSSGTSGTTASNSSDSSDSGPIDPVASSSGGAATVGEDESSSTTGGGTLGGSSTGEPEPCGNGVVDITEDCDDANEDSSDGCLANCIIPRSCSDIRDHAPGARSGVYLIDSDGPSGFATCQAYCDMEHAGGGWTLALVSADDAHETWTWNNRELMTVDTFLVGDVHDLGRDYKSASHHLLSFADLLFVHQPSGVWTSYDGVSDQSVDFGTFMSELPFPECDENAGFPMTEGDLSTVGSNLCSTDLFFHLGDYDGDATAHDTCLDVMSPVEGGTATGTYGPSWNVNTNQGCPMDDPEMHGLGPLAATCGPTCEAWGDIERDGRGFAQGMGVQTSGDRLEVYIR